MTRNFAENKLKANLLQIKIDDKQFSSFSIPTKVGVARLYGNKRSNTTIHLCTDKHEMNLHVTLGG